MMPTPVRRYRAECRPCETLAGRETLFRRAVHLHAQWCRTIQRAQDRPVQFWWYDSTWLDVDDGVW
jgi:hypothetical protein